MTLRHPQRRGRGVLSRCIQCQFPIVTLWEHKMILFGRIWDTSKISIAEALKLVDVSKTTLYRDLKENRLSSTTDAKGKKVIDIAELERFYGQLKSPSVNGAGHNGTGGNPASDNSEHNGTVDGSPDVIAVLEDQVAVLKSQLECEREEKVKLIDMLAMEQEKPKMLMLPQAAPEQVKNKASWLGYFRRKR